MDILLKPEEIEMVETFRQEKGLSLQDAITELIRAGLDHWVLVREVQDNS